MKCLPSEILLRRPPIGDFTRAKPISSGPATPCPVAQEDGTGVAPADGTGACPVAPADGTGENSSEAGERSIF